MRPGTLMLLVLAIASFIAGFRTDSLVVGPLSWIVPMLVVAHLAIEANRREDRGRPPHP
jgi:hypothetical protein